MTNYGSFRPTITKCVISTKQQPPNVRARAGAGSGHPSQWKHSARSGCMESRGIQHRLVELEQMRNFVSRKTGTSCFRAADGYGSPGRSFQRANTRCCRSSILLPARSGAPDPAFGWPGRQGILRNSYHNRTNEPLRLLTLNERFIVNRSMNHASLSAGR